MTPTEAKYLREISRKYKNVWIINIILMIALCLSIAIIFHSRSIADRDVSLHQMKIDSLQNVATIAIHDADLAKAESEKNRRASDSIYKVWSNKKPSTVNKENYEKDLSAIHSNDAVNNARLLTAWINQ